MTNTEILNENSVVLVTGGGKGITAQCAIRLAEFAHCKLILIGRSRPLETVPDWAIGVENRKDLQSRALAALTESGQKPSPKQIQNVIRQIESTREINTTLTKIQDAGGTAIYVSADVTDFNHLNSSLNQAIATFGSVTGIIHGAGNLADKKIESKTARDFEHVVHPKIFGLNNILKILDTTNLEFVVLFSSVAGFFGNAGQTDYAIANEILNKSAHLLQQSLPNCRVLSINWGPWDSGMVSPQLRKFFEERNIPLISAGKGVEMLLDELTREGIGETQILVGASLDQENEINHKYPETIHIRRVIQHDKNPFLNDHVIGDQAVLPATCASAWLADVCVALHPGFAFTSMDDFKILKGLTFDNDARDYDLELKNLHPENADEKHYDILVTSENEKGKTIFHYSGKVKLNRNLLDPPVHSLTDLTGGQNPSFRNGTDFYENGTLFHGPAFQGIQEVHQLSKERVVTRVSLPAMNSETQGQFKAINTNPYINDAIVQSLLIWTQEVYEAPCLPSRLHHWDNYRSVPFGESVWAVLDITYHNEHAVTGDIIVADQDGSEIFKFTGLEGTISKHLKRFIGKKA